MKTYTTENGIEINDYDVFAIRLFVFTETNCEVSLPIKSILKLVDIFDAVQKNKEEQK